MTMLINKLNARWPYFDSMYQIARTPLLFSEDAVEQPTLWYPVDRDGPIVLPSTQVKSAFDSRPSPVRRASKSANPGVCPICGLLDNTYKVSAVHKSGFSNIKHGQEVAIGQTKLSRNLAPPPEPIHPLQQGGCSMISVLIVVTFGPMFLTMLLFGDEPEMVWVGCGLGLFLLSIIAFIIHRDWERSGAKPNWENAMSRWNRLYYCMRDDIVFLPGEDGNASSENMVEFLYDEI
jgi:hypothetical protein